MKFSETTKKAVAQMMVLRGSPQLPDALKAFSASLEGILQMVGESRFDKAVHRCITELSYFPSIPEFEEKLPPPNQERTTCPRCVNSEGWEYCEVRSKDGHFSRGVRKCQH